MAVRAGPVQILADFRQIMENWGVRETSSGRPSQFVIERASWTSDLARDLSSDKTHRGMPKTSKVAGKPGGDTHSVGVRALGGDERVFRDFMSDIFAAAATMQTLRRLSAKPFGLSSTEFAVMIAVAKLNSEPGIRRIADHFHVERHRGCQQAGEGTTAGQASRSGGCTRHQIGRH